MAAIRPGNLVWLSTLMVGAVLSAAVVERSSEPNLLLTLYYESLCPYSKMFVTNQLLPNYETFKPFVDVVLVPFGKAISSTDNGTVHYECQHGEPECFLNKLQSCALYTLNGLPDAKMQYVACEMRTEGDHDPTNRECPDRSNISRTEMDNCQNGGLGVQLQLEAERHTHRVRVPYPVGIPTVTFDDVYTQAQSQRAIGDLALVLCEQLHGRPAPSVCNAP